ncbi:hypothetical protein SRB17_32180 [Streptomyces sp. RB17]|nr:hypothetical protein [Streptomyces sp. RB17]
MGREHRAVEGEWTPERFAGKAGRLVVSRRGRQHGPIDDALAELGLGRRVVASVGTFPASLFVPRETDLIGLITTYSTTPTPPTPGCARAYGSR